MNHVVVSVLAALGLYPAIARADITPEQKLYFEERVAPVLSENCYKCHKAGEKTRGGLALDSREGLLKGGDDGKVLIPGHPGDSDLIKRINSLDPEERMPPKDARLTATQIAELTAWVKMGAPDPRIAIIAGQETGAGKNHWAWQPIHQETPPVVKETAWCKTPIDRFIAAKLEEKGMTPSEPDDRAGLIRRAYFDLIGLPPMPWEVQAFIDDKSADAWDNVVDRLLASPHYGERWGRFWLDVARYSDTKGDAGKKQDPLYVDAWTYRDYVIDAFNQNKPFDRFILEQVAADKLDLGSDKQALAGLGFLTVGDRFNGNRNDMINDQIDVVTKGFLGLTVTCARCHDHKFDPIPQKDYYSLHGIFASTVEPKDNPVIAAEGNARQYAEYIRDRDAALKGAKEFAATELEKVRQLFRAHSGAFLLAARAPAGPERNRTIQGIGGQPRVAQELVQALSRNPNLLRRSPIFGPWTRFAEIPLADFTAKSAAVVAELAADGDKAHGNPVVLALFVGKPAPASLDEVAARYGNLFRQVEERSSRLSPVSVRSAGRAPAVTAVSLPASPSPDLSSGPAPGAGAPSPAQPSPEERAWEELRLAPFRVDPLKDFDEKEIAQKLPPRLALQFQQKLAAVAKVELTHPGAPKRAMVVEDAARPQNSPVFIRGEASSKGEMAPRRFLEILSGPDRPEFTDGSGRLQLAHAIASADNPLTARVIVNRVWDHHFGAGIVSTPDDFGTQSAPPSHPELLDYLAAQFVQSGWNIKALHKSIMTSAVYQQRSDTKAAYARIDPENRLLWHANLRRLEFEPLRDTLLYIAGKLDTTVGGHPVNILSEPYSTRRSVYGFIDRGNLPEMMNHFDFANPGMPLGKRHVTMGPQQALFMMNSPLMVEVAQCLLERPEMQAAKTDAQRVHALYWMIYQRPARPEEINLGLNFLRSVVAAQAVNPPSPPALPAAAASTSGSMQKLAGVSKEQIIAMRKEKVQELRKGGGFQLENSGEKVMRRELTAWEEYTHALLMANEAVYYN